MRIIKKVIIVIVILFIITPNIYAGQKIRTAQKNLIMLGYNLVIDGIYGQETKKAIKDFQKKNYELKVTGKLDNNTYKTLNRLVSFEKVLVTAWDTIHTISNEYNISVNKLKEINNLENNIVEVGEYLIIPNSNIGSLDKYSLYTLIDYKIKPKDNLHKLAQKYNTTVEKIKKINNINYKNITKTKYIKIPKKIIEGEDYYNRDNHYNQNNNNYIYPIKGQITSTFGQRLHPITKERHLHAGIDIKCSIGEKIKATKSGKVLYSGWIKGFGKTVTIDHGDGIVSLYGHNSKNLVKKDDFIKTGEVIALSGNTGNTTGPHLHFGIYKNNEPMNPKKFLE